MIDLAKKDLDIAIKFSEVLGVPISLALQAEKIYKEAQEDGRGGQDWTAIFDMLHKRNSRISYAKPLCYRRKVFKGAKTI